jgi:hypothetical protein
MWSVGVITYTICTGTHPFDVNYANGETDKDISKKIGNYQAIEGNDVYDKVFNKEEFKNISDEEAQNFIKQCLTPVFKEGDCPYSGDNDR